MLWFTLRVATESCTNRFMISAEISTSLALGKAAGRSDLKIIQCMFNILGTFHSFCCFLWYLITFPALDSHSPLLFLFLMATLKPLKPPQGMFLNFLHPAEWQRPRERCKLFPFEGEEKKKWGSPIIPDTTCLVTALSHYGLLMRLSLGKLPTLPLPWWISPWLLHMIMAKGPSSLIFRVCKQTFEELKRLF